MPSEHSELMDAIHFETGAELERIAVEAGLKVLEQAVIDKRQKLALLVAASFNVQQLQERQGAHWPADLGEPIQLKIIALCVFPGMPFCAMACQTFRDLTRCTANYSRKPLHAEQ